MMTWIDLDYTVMKRLKADNSVELYQPLLHFLTKQRNA
jgi:hypothetical protein